LGYYSENGLPCEQPFCLWVPNNWDPHVTDPELPPWQRAMEARRGSTAAADHVADGRAFRQCDKPVADLIGGGEEQLRPEAEEQRSDVVPAQEDLGNVSSLAVGADHIEPVAAGSQYPRPNAAAIGMFSSSCKDSSESNRFKRPNGRAELSALVAGLRSRRYA
jgi:hypothetical protein